MVDKIEVKELRSFFDEEGELFEVLRSDDSMYNGGFGQNLVSIVKPNIIKGFHRHNFQTEYTTCINGEILYIAVTENPGKEPLIQKFVISPDHRILLKTPLGIWHGYKALEKEAVILYAMDKPYNSKYPDTADRDPMFFGDIWNKI